MVGKTWAELVKCTLNKKGRSQPQLCKTLSPSTLGFSEIHFFKLTPTSSSTSTSPSTSPPPLLNSHLCFNAVPSRRSAQTHRWSTLSASNPPAAPSRQLAQTHATIRLRPTPPIGVLARGRCACLWLVIFYFVCDWWFCLVWVEEKDWRFRWLWLVLWMFFG